MRRINTLVLLLATALLLAGCNAMDGTDDASRDDGGMMDGGGY